MAAKAQQTAAEAQENPLPLAKTKARFWELDFIRGLCVLLMVVDHFFFTAGFVLPQAQAALGVEFWNGLTNFAILYWYSYIRNFTWFFVVSAFLLVCGISCTLTRSNLWRGLRAAGVALAITLVTALLSRILDTPLTIWFGVIHMYAAAILIYYLLSLAGTGIKKLLVRLTRKREGIAITVFDWVERLLPGVVGLIVLIVYFCVPWGHFVIKEYPDDYLVYPQLVTDVTVNGSIAFKSFVSLFIDISTGEWFFNSADYFPIVPYVPMVLIGSLIGRLVYNTKAKTALKPLDGKWNKPVTFLGRHALLIYILHQVAFVAFMFLAAAAVYITK